MIPSTVQGVMDVYTAREMPTHRFLSLATEEGLKEVAREAWSTDAPILDMESGVTEHLFIDRVGEHEDYRVFRHGSALVFAHRSGGVEETGRLLVTAAAKDVADAKAAIDYVREQMPKAVEPLDETVRVRFWSLAKNGPTVTERRIHAAPFETIEENYTSSVRKGMKSMIAPDFKPGRGGQLLLWHGEPGTGKTFALRALAREWRAWCDIDYIVDPEHFFGEAAYMMPVLLSRGEDGPTVEEDPDEDSPKPKARWRLLVFEDTGELLTADARERTGQGLSRLLNVVDGFIGQGLRILLLITTNEEVSKLHPAVARPGRCAVNLAFKKMSEMEASIWANKHGFDLRSASGASLAELYARLDGHDNGSATPRPIGFRAKDEPAA